MALIIFALCLYGASEQDLIAQAAEAYKNKQYDDAANLFAKACEQKNVAGCLNLAVLYDRGWGIQQDFSKAAYYYTQTCDYGEAMGCTGLGVLYKDGKALKQDYAKALELFNKACEDGDNQGCVNLGTMYEDGLGVKKDDEKAHRIYAEACTNSKGSGKLVGCTNLGKLHEKHSHYLTAIEVYTFPCRYHEAEACYRIGRIYAGIGHANETSQDMKLGIKYLEEACDYKSADACNDLGLIYELGIKVSKSKTKAKKFYEKGCKLKNERGCVGYDRLTK